MKIQALQLENRIHGPIKTPSGAINNLLFLITKNIIIKNNRIIETIRKDKRIMKRRVRNRLKSQKKML